MAEAKERTESVTIRCAVIGGMMDTGFWPELVRRFEASHGHRIEVVAEGPKRVISQAFVAGEADLITMHAGDTIINLVADGYGVDPQPWAKNDLVLVGPANDPASIRGMTDDCGVPTSSSRQTPRGCRKRRPPPQSSLPTTCEHRQHRRGSPNTDAGSSTSGRCFFP